MPNKIDSVLIGGHDEVRNASGDLGKLYQSYQTQPQVLPFSIPLRYASGSGTHPALSPNIRTRIPFKRGQRLCLINNSRTLPWIINSTSYLDFKAETIGWINERLSDRKAALEDITIGAIMCLTNWEIARGGFLELDYHIAGLQKIVDLRGGFSALGDKNGFRFKLQLIELMGAAIHGTSPRFVLQSNLNSAYGPLPSGLARMDSPLYGKKKLSTAFVDSPFAISTVLLLESMQEITRAVENNKYNKDGYFRPHDPVLRGCSLPNLLSNRPDTPSLEKIIYYTTIIYSGALSSPRIPFSSPLNLDSVKHIAHCLEGTSNDVVWAHYPEILIWILLTATAAAVNSLERPFFVVFLARVGTSAIPNSWQEMSQMLLKFLALRRISENGGEIGRKRRAQFEECSP